MRKEKTVWSASAFSPGCARIAVFFALLVVMLLFNVALALAQVQSHRLSETRVIDSNLNMGPYQINTSRINSTNGYFTGNVGIGTGSLTDPLTVAGNINVTGVKLTTNCVNGQVLKWSGGVGACGTDDTLGSGAVTGDGASGLLAVWNGTSSVNSSSNLVWDFTNSRLGIGAASPEFMLSLDSDGGIIAKGLFGSGASLSTSGAGARLVWYPRKAAFRAGYTNSDRWDDSNIGDYSVSLGRSGLANASYSTVGGGRDNEANETYSVVSGGQANHAYGISSSVGGGQGNYATATLSSVGGGLSNYANGSESAIGGGTFNHAHGTYSAVGGGYQNDASAHAAFIGGGYGNKANNSYATVGAGYSNVARGQYSTVGGGQSNVAGDDSTTVAGGLGNLATGQYSVVGGGVLNNATGYNSIISGGYANRAAGYFGTVGGGWNNTADGDYSWVAGKNMQLDSNADFSFAWGYSDVPVNINTIYTFLIDPNNFGIKVGIGTTNPSAKLDVQGGGLLAGLFNGSVAVTGNVTVGTGTVFIDGKNSRIGVNTTTPSYSIEVRGSIVANASGTNYHGIVGYANGTNGGAVLGMYNSTILGALGLGRYSGWFVNLNPGSEDMYGVYTRVNGSGAGKRYGVYATVGDSAEGYALYGQYNSSIYGYIGSGNTGTNTFRGMYAQYDGSNYGYIGTSNTGVYGRGSKYGVSGYSDSGSGGYGVFGIGDSGVEGQYVGNTETKGVLGSNGIGVQGVLNSTTYAYLGYNSSGDGYGLFATGDSYAGYLYHLGSPMTTVYLASDGIGVEASGSTYGVKGASALGYAGFFDGKVKVYGSLNVTGIVQLQNSDAPAACDTTTEGAVYYDASLNEPCFCNGSAWTQFDGGGGC